MQALARIVIAPREIKVFHRQSGVAEFPTRSVGFQKDWHGHFPEIVGSASGLASRNALDLTDRECTILQLLSRGFSNKEAAKSLGISPETVKSHVKNIFQKLCVDRRAQAVSRALGLGVITAN